jgi:hypothetical protein
MVWAPGGLDVAGFISFARVVAAVGASRNCVAPAPIFFAAIATGWLVRRSAKTTSTGPG